MASVKRTGTLQLLFLGILLSLVLVTEQTSTIAPSTDTSSMNETATSSSSSTMSATTQTSTAMDTRNTTTSMAQSTVSTTNGGTETTTPMSLTSTSGGSDSSTSQSHTSTWMASSTTLSATSTSGGSSSNTAFTSTSEGSSTMSSSPTMSSGSSTSVMASHGISVTPNATSMNMFCPSFTCSHSECCSMYTSQNATRCADTEYCQLMRCEGMLYNASCSASCAQSCNSTSQVNCSVKCCNSTGCLNNTFASMMPTTTMATTSKSTAQSTSTTTLTTANKGNKCQKGTCTGDKCYATFNVLETCSSSQPHCQLKQSSTATWTAGCANCSSEITCTASIQPPCVQECCIASMTSCLFLNGTSNDNVHSFATRGPHFHTDLIVFLLCLLSVTQLL